MMRPSLYFSVLGVLLAMGIAQGVVTYRWQTRVDLDATIADMSSIPLHVGDWDGSSIERGQIEALESERGPELTRRYVNRVDGSAVTVYLLGGPAGPTYAAHSPLSCYPGAGYVAAGSPVRFAFDVKGDSKKQEFFAMNFSKERAAITQHVQLYWAYSGNGDWKAPDYGRLEFAGYRKLFKLYVIREVPSEQALGDDPAVAFIKAFIPQLNKAIFRS
jgi:hypothetical protein